MNLVVSFPNATVEYKKRPQREGRFGVVKLDYNQVWEDGTTKKSRPSRNKSPMQVEGLPATARFVVGGSSEYVTLGKELQLWMHGLCHRRIPSLSVQYAKDQWKSLMWGGRMITDFAGSDTHADFVNETHLSAEPMKLKPMVTGGAVLKIKGEKRVSGIDCYVVEAINPLNFKSYDPITHWWLFFFPSISRREGIISSDRALIEDISIPFPQYAERTILPVFAMAGMNENYIPKFRVRLLENDPIPNPFLAHNRVIGNPYI